jgi:hypothetical protein
MRRTNWKTVSTLVTMALLTGCTDRSVSAPDASSVAPVSMLLAPQAMPALSLNGGSPGNTSVDFVVGPWGGIFYTGNNAVVIPAHAICDPATSSYGPGTWDSSCKALEGSLKIHAEVRTQGGRTWVDFSPSLRFVPSSNQSNWAYIYIFSPGAKGAADLGKFNILYASTIGGNTVDESLQDATLRTYVDTRLGIVTRRIKHFSGYTSSGFYDPNCTPGVDQDCSGSPTTVGGP